MTTLSRRALLLAAVALPLAAPARAQGGPITATRYRSVRPDVSGLVQRGLPNYAVKVEAMAKRALADAFADRMAPRDPAAADLVLHVDEILLTADTTQGNSLFPGGSEDQFVGRISIAVGGRRETRRFDVSRPPSSGPWNAPDYEDRRLADLLRLAVGWARREFEP